jgi:hypothetical protein
MTNEANYALSTQVSAGPSAGQWGKPIGFAPWFFVRRQASYMPAETPVRVYLVTGEPSEGEGTPAWAGRAGEMPEAEPNPDGGSASSGPESPAPSGAPNPGQEGPTPAPAEPLFHCDGKFGGQWLPNGSAASWAAWVKRARRAIIGGGTRWRLTRADGSVAWEGACAELPKEAPAAPAPAPNEVEAFDALVKGAGAGAALGWLACTPPQVKRATQCLSYGLAGFPAYPSDAVLEVANAPELDDLRTAHEAALRRAGELEYELAELRRGGR